MNIRKISYYGEEIVLQEYVPDLYLIHTRANKALDELRKGVLTWVIPEIQHKMKVSIWIYDNLSKVNAFCRCVDNHNYIVLSTGLLFAFWREVEDFVDHEKYSLVFKLSEDGKPHFKDVLFFSMLNFIIAHEYGHIVHGHLKDGRCGYCIDEALEVRAEGNNQTKNWITQLKEYDADSFAVMMQSALLLQEWSEDTNINAANVDVIFIANYLCFRTFAEKTGRSFVRYMEKEYADVDHPHPGIRMYYSVLLFSYWIGRVRGNTEDVINTLSSGTHAIVAYEKNVLEATDIKSCYFSIAFTEKGCQHVMNLHNGWQELIEYYNQFAYLPIPAMDDIDSLPVSVNENGTFFKREENE